VTIRDLRNRSGEVVDRVVAGERLTVTRSGKAVAELRPVPPDSLTGAVLVERRRRLPHLDPELSKRDVDAVLDPEL
jgi:prevent-host-death family protein